jgi:hypothetical protein
LQKDPKAAVSATREEERRPSAKTPFMLERGRGEEGAGREWTLGKEEQRGPLRLVFWLRGGCVIPSRALIGQFFSIGNKGRYLRVI